MSLFEEVERAKNPFGQLGETASKAQSVTFINQTSTLLNILNAELTSHKIATKTANKFKGHRSRLGDCSWCLHHLQGSVNEEIWRFNVNASISGMLKTIGNSQPNGDWQLVDYEVKIGHDKSSVERIFLAAKFVDANDAEDLQYNNGVPSTTINVKANPIPTELLEALSKKGDGDDELKMLLKQLVASMAQNQMESPQEQVVSFDEQPAPLSFED